MKTRSDRLAFTLIELLVVIAIIGVLLSLTLVAVQRAREAANRTRCQSNMRQIGLALQQYHDAHGLFPPGVSVRNGKDPYPFMSWNTRLLPYLEQSGMWRTAQSAFDQQKFFLINPPHVGLSTLMPVYGCPSDGRTLDVANPGGSIRVAFTSYLGVEGTDQFRRDGLLYMDSSTRHADILDGASNTLFVGERPPSADGVLGWWYAGWGQSQDGSCDMVLGVREVNAADYGPGCPRGPYTFTPGRVNNQCDTFHFWSLHPGGAHFLFADGSVRFLAYSADPIMPALATRRGGEAVSLPD